MGSSNNNMDVTALQNAAIQNKRLNSADAKIATAELQRVQQMVADPSQDHTAAVQSSVGVINSAVRELSSNLNKIQQQVTAGGPGASDPSLKAAWEKGNAQLTKLQEGVGKLNTALYQAGSTQRVQWTGSGVSLSSVNSSAQGNLASAAPASTMTSALAQDTPGTGMQLDQAVSPDIKNSALYPILKAAVQEVVQQLMAGTIGDASTSDAQPATTDAAVQSSQNASTSAPATSSASDGTAAPSTKAHHYSPGPNAATAGEGDGAQLGEGSPMFNAFLKAVKSAAEAAQGKSTAPQSGSKSGKGGTSAGGAGNSGTGANAGVGGTDANAGVGDTNGADAAVSSTNAGTGANAGVTQTTTPVSTGTAGHAGSTTPSTSSAAATTGAQDPGNTIIKGNDNLPIGMANGAPSDNSGAAGDPMASSENINGFLMMVLLESYQEVNKGLKVLAQRLQDLTAQKAKLRTKIAGERNSSGSQSNVVQNDEDNLNSLGDDSQLQQMDLQNMAQAQQELLQMISNFSKNTHDDSMAIIRHVGGG